MPSLAEMNDVDKACFLDAPSPRRGCSATPSRALPSSSRRYSSRRDASSTAAPGARPQSARRRGRPPACSRAAPPQAESTPKPARRASCRRAATPEMLEFALSQETARTFLLAGVPLEQVSQQMPPAWAGAPHAMGRQRRGSRQVPDCFGISTA